MRDIPARDHRAAVVLHSALLDALILAASLPSSGTALAPTSFRPMVLVLGLAQQPLLLPFSVFEL